jgi:hypothetical protein
VKAVEDELASARDDKAKAEKRLALAETEIKALRSIKHFDPKPLVDRVARIEGTIDSQADTFGEIKKRISDVEYETAILGKGIKALVVADAEVVKSIGAVRRDLMALRDRVFDLALELSEIKKRLIKDDGRPSSLDGTWILTSIERAGKKFVDMDDVKVAIDIAVAPLKLPFSFGLKSETIRGLVDVEDDRLRILVRDKGLPESFDPRQPDAVLLTFTRKK